MSRPLDLERTQAALARTLRAYSSTLTAYADLVGLHPEEDDELVYETVSSRLRELEHLRADLDACQQQHMAQQTSTAYELGQQHAHAAVDAEVLRLRAELAEYVRAHELMVAQFKTMQREKEHGWRVAERREDKAEALRAELAHRDEQLGGAS